ncbi:response regulator [Streptomyces inhibens]|uniref:response regulator n=1 Tax=Streptomyces inhibens TaxID=2293571 RepID=UPI0037A9640C
MYSVMVVDDIASMADQLAELITLRTGLRALPCNTPEAAISAVQEHPIRVVLLDQRMPARSGTELYSEIRRVAPDVKAIMVTGEANSSEVGQALTLGFSDYVEKGEVAKLPDVVLKWYCQYEVEAASAAASRDLEVLEAGRRRFLFFGDRIQYRLAALQVLHDAHVIPDSWSTVQQINAGQERKHTYSVSVKDTFIVEDSRQYATKAKGGLAGELSRNVKLSASIESAVTRAVKRVRTSETVATETEEVTYRLPEETSEPSVNYVKSRHIQCAPAYRRLRLVVEKSCTCCDQWSLEPLIVLSFGGVYATQQVDYYRDGTSATISTGLIRPPG